MRQVIINNLKNIDFNKINIDQYYDYNGLKFLSKMQYKNKNIIISFHGSIPITSKNTYNHIFRGYNYRLDNYNTDLICISDFLLSKYKSTYIVSWGLETEKYKTDTIYQELFDYIFKHKKYNKIIFAGTSAGGFPSIKFASIYNAIAIISNCQLYIENYNNNNGIKLLNDMVLDNDKFIYKNKLIEDYILKSQPKQIIYYINKNDTYLASEDKDKKVPINMQHCAYSDFLQFSKFIEYNNLSHILKPIVFEYNINKCKKQLKHTIFKIPILNHKIYYPNNIKHQAILTYFIINNKPYVR